MLLTLHKHTPENLFQHIPTLSLLFFTQNWPLGELYLHKILPPLSTPLPDGTPLSALLSTLLTALITVAKADTQHFGKALELLKGECVRRGLHELIPELLNQHDLEGMTPVIAAVLHNASGALTALLEAGASPNTPFHVKSQHQHKDLSPFQLAAATANLTCLWQFVRDDVDRTQHTSDGASAVHLLCTSETQLHERLLKAGFEMLYASGNSLMEKMGNESGHTPLMLACKHGYNAAITLLTEPGCKKSTWKVLNAGAHCSICLTMLMSKHTDSPICAACGASGQLPCT